MLAQWRLACGVASSRLGFWTVCTALVAASCAPAESGRPPNVVLISVDSLRADHLGTYGYARDTSPAIDAFAAEAVVFEAAFSQAPWTLPSHASLLTSQYPRTHRADGLRARLAPGVETLASVLSAAGYDTAAVVTGPFMKRTFGLDAGFRSYDDSLATRSLRGSHAGVTSNRLHERALTQLDRLKPPFFLFLHYWDVHYDYEPPEPYDRLFDPDYDGTLDGKSFEQNPEVHAGMEARDLEHLVALYDGEIRHFDGYLRRLLEALRQRGLTEDTIIVFTADHGDEFYEHGEKGHGHSIYNELVRVPLLIRAPGAAGGLRVSRTVQHVDVFPTILELAGLEPRAHDLQGRSLVPLLEGGSLPSRPVFVETSRFRRAKSPQAPKPGGPAKPIAAVRPGRRSFSTALSVIEGRHKLIRHSDPAFADELYDLQADPGEVQALIDPAVHARLDAVLASWIAEFPRRARAARADVDPDTARELEALGYVGGE